MKRKIRKNNEEKRKFKRSFAITLTLIICILIAVTGISLAYENTVQTALGEYKKAFRITSEGIGILDFELKF